MIGSLADLAKTGLASEPTLRRWLRDQPVDCEWILKRGTNGDAYEIDLTAAISAWRGEQAKRAEAEQQKAQDLRQIGLELGLTVQEGPTISIADRKALIDEEVAAMKLSQLRRELVPVVSVEAAFGDILARYAQRAASFAARLAKKIDLTREQIAAIEALRAADQTWFADQMEKWGKGIVDVDGDTGAALETAPAHDRR